MPSGMATDRIGTVHGQDLRRLLDSDLADPVLVLQEGRAEVVPGDGRDRSGLEIVSRAEFVGRAGRTTFSDEDLERQAARLSTAVDELGG
jgi:hypothetical protein